MDPFELDLNPAMNSGIFYQKTYSSNSLNFLEQQEFPNFEDQEDNFAENFNKAFQPNSPDIKEDSISEINNLYDLTNIDEFIIRFQNENLNNYYFKRDFDGIINQIEKQFPFFFNEKNSELLYLIEKLRFFNLLKENRFEEAKKFYQDKLIVLIKETKKQNWEIKSKFFIKLLKKPILIEKQGDLQKKYYDQFSFELEKAIRSFLHDENDELSKNDFLTNSNNINYFASSTSMELDNFQNINYNKEKKIEKKLNKGISKEKTNDGDNGININNNSNEESDEFDLDNFSTKEEFSDFEDELQAKMSSNAENQKNINKKEDNGNGIKLNKFINDDEDIDDIGLDPVNNNNPFFSNWSVTSFSKSHKSSYEIEINQKKEEENEFIIDTSSKNNLNIIEEKVIFDENKKNYAIYENPSKFENINTGSIKKKNNKKEKKKNEEIIFNQLPFLNSFKPKYIKRETIDKKIIRTFKNYVVKENKEKRLEIDQAKMDHNFFIHLLYGNILPPIDFIDGNTGEIVKYNSFNCKYLLWFFSKKGVKDVYLQFINEKGKEFIKELSEHYEISIEEKNQLNNYISNFPFIFDISIINNITNGTEISHIYRTVEKNKKLQIERRKRGDNDLDLKKYDSNSSIGHRERSRSRDFNDNDI